MGQSQWPGTGTSDASGNVTITFPRINVSTEFTGVVSVPLAPNTAQWQVVVTDSVVATMGGSSQYGAMQLSNSDMLQLKGTGLTPNTQYEGMLIGSLVSGSSPAVIPTPTASALQAALIGAISATAPPAASVYSNPALGSGVVDNFNVALTVRTLFITLLTPLANPVTNLLITAQTGGFDAPYNQAPYIAGSNASFNYYFVVVPVTALISTGMLIDLTITGGGSANVHIYGDTVLTPESAFYNGVMKTAQVNATGTLLTGPARLLSANCGGAAAANITLGGNAIVAALAGAGAVQSFPPNTVLPAGQTLQGFVGGAGTACSINYAYP